MGHRQSRRSAEEHDAVAEQMRDVEAARHEAAVGLAAFGGEGPPAGFDAGRWRGPVALAALAYYAKALAHTPRKYHGWLLGLIRELVDVASADPRAVEAIAQGTSFD